MRDWKKEQRLLDQDLVDELLRDAGVLEGLATEDDEPGDFVGRTIGDLGFDDPPMPSQPTLEREAYFYFVMTLLKHTGNRISKQHFSYTGWMDAKDSVKLKSFATVIFNKHTR